MKNLKKIKIVVLVFSGLMFSSCAHNHKDVRPGIDGLNKVVVVAPDTETGTRSALEQATSFCKSKSKDLAVVKESSKYTGDMDEQAYNNAKRVAKVAGSIGWAAGAVGLGDDAQKALGNAYTVQIDFKCQ